MNYLIIYFAVLLSFISACTIQDTSKDDFNIVLITIDTLRADHLSCYGYERETSPNIDKVAEKGILFKNVVAPAPWTAPSMVSLFTSTYPINHGVVHGFKHRDLTRKHNIYTQQVFSDKLATLPEILKKQGYTTFGISSNPNLTEEFGFARGFDYFQYLPSIPASRINKMAYLWENKIKASDKYFLWVHYLDPHSPYNARTPWVEHYTTQLSIQNLNFFSRSMRKLNDSIRTFNNNPQALSTLMALYDSEINHVDSYVGQLIQNFDLDKNTLLIITSDHGEQFLEHGRIGHSWNLHREEIDVPLIIQLPNAYEMVMIDNQVSLLDIVPTILHILDTVSPEQTLGKVLLEDEDPLNWLKTTLSRRSKTSYNFAELDKGFISKAILTAEWKYIYNYKDKTDQLYSIKSDPKELNNLASINPKQCDQLKKQLLNWVSSSKRYPVKSQSFKLSQEEREKLEVMGYLDTQDMNVAQ